MAVFNLPLDIESLLQFDSASLNVATREGKHFEFKCDFIPNDLSDYGKTLAAFSNADGGVLIFGISDEPRKILGVGHIVDEAQWANRLREDFDPEIVISTRIYRVGTLTLLAVGVDPSKKVAGVILTQILPFVDPRVLNLYAALESGVYKSLS
jgi:predicted HTH transcriptional regulator